jgi:hypothetical protein
MFSLTRSSDALAGKWGQIYFLVYRQLETRGPNKAVEPTPYSLRFASAFGRGSPPAFGF